MPRATVNGEPTRIELKSCPGGFVMLSQLAFGSMLTRRDRATRFLQEVDPKAEEGDLQHIQIDILNEASRLYDFSHCIVDHNLENDLGLKLDFSENMVAMTLQILDPRIGAEIEREIDKLNREDEDDEKGFTTPVGQPSTSSPAKQQKD